MESTVSWISSYKVKTVKHQSLGEALADIRDGAVKDKVLLMRSLYATNHDRYDEIKETLPAHIFSGRFVGGHGKENLVEYNRLLTIDIDKLEDERIAAVGEQLRIDPHVYVYWLSPSGKGYKGLVLLDYGDVELNDAAYWHREAFNQLYAYFKDKYDIELDKKCKDVPRICFVSYDPNLCVKDDSVAFKVQPIEEVRVAKDMAAKAKKAKASWKYKGTHYNQIISGRNKPGSRKLMGSILRYLENRKLSITTSYDEWFSVAMAIVTTFNYDIGREYYLRLCRLDGRGHDEQASVSMLQYCYEHSNYDITFGTLIYYAQRKGYKFNNRAVPAVDIRPGVQLLA